MSLESLISQRTAQVLRPRRCKCSFALLVLSLFVYDALLDGRRHVCTPYTSEHAPMKLLKVHSTNEMVCAGVKARLRKDKGLRFALTDSLNLSGQRHSDVLEIDQMSLASNNTPIPFRFPEEIRLRYIQEHDSVAQGSFLVQPVLALLAELTKVQARHSIRGAIGEIGVHHGKFFVGLAHLAMNHEKLWACDVFEDQALNMDGSGFGDRRAFEQACQSHGIGNEDVDVNSGGSADITQLPYKFRLFSVDGGHTRELTVNDLTVAASHLEEGGIIILDDITNLAWPQVIDGFFTWMSYFPQQYAPFFVGYNKVFITQERYHELFYDTLVQYAANAPEGMRLSKEPSSNTNPHKSKDSGKNQFKWSGYAFVWGDNTVDVTTATSEWTKAIS